MADQATPLLHHLRRLAVPCAWDPASDAELLERFLQDRDETAFTALVARHGPMVLRLCQRVLADAHAAEDCCQATFLVLARKAAAVRRRHALAAWLHGVAWRLARKERARACRQPRPLPTSGADQSPADPRSDPLAALTVRELLTALDEEIQRLPEIYRLPVLLCCLEGRTREEVARLLGWTPGSVKGRLERGRQRLHARLQQRGLTLSVALAALEAARGLATAGLPAALLAATATAATRFAARQAVPVGMVSARALGLAEGMVKAMLLRKTGLVAVVFLAMSVLTGLAVLVSQQTTAAPLREVPRGETKKVPLWAAISVSKPVFQEGGTGELQILFTVVNDGKEVLDSRVSASRLLVNGKELAGSAMIFGNGPRDARFTALPPGDHLEFGYALGRYFSKPGVYRVSWQGQGFQSAAIVFRVLPKKDPELKPAQVGKDGLIQGVVERVVAVDGGDALLLQGVGWVAINDRTEYLAETGLDARPASLKEVLGKRVYVGTQKRGDKPVATVVVITFLGMR